MMIVNLAEIPVIIPKKDCKSLLLTVKEGMSDFEYVTPAMFSGMVSVVVLSYLRGGGHLLDSPKKAKERVSMLEIGIENLVSFSLDSDAFGWFIESLDKLQTAVGERELLSE